MVFRRFRKATQLFPQNALNIVLYGGGSGSEALLPGLRRRSRQLSAIIAITDNGKDSGKLREVLGYAPGDIRRACVALAANPDGLMAQLFRVRMPERYPDRAGQSFGNSVFAAAAECGLDMTGQLAAVSRLLDVTGLVYPATYERVGLVAEMADGATVYGETTIADYPAPVRRVRLDPEEARPPAGVLEAVSQADAVVLGPGSVATSLLPALLPSAAAVAECRAARFIVINSASEGPYDFSSASDYVRLIESHFPGRRLFDCVLCHQLAENTPTEGIRPVEADLEAIRALGYSAVSAQLLGADGRHDGDRVAALVIELTPQFSRRKPSMDFHGKKPFTTTAHFGGR